MSLSKSIVLLVVSVILTMLFAGFVSAANCGGAIQCSCGDTLTSSHTMWYDLTGCSSNGLNIGADNLVLNCNGYSITGSAIGYGINAATSGDARSNTTLMNCIISNFETDIYARGADGGGAGYLSGSVTIIDSDAATVNTDGSDGDNIGQHAGAATIIGSTISSINANGGSATYDAGHGGNIMSIDSTIGSISSHGGSQNSNLGSFGNGGSITVTNSSITSINAGGGGGYRNAGDGGDITLTDSNAGSIYSVGGYGYAGFPGSSGDVTLTNSDVVTINVQGQHSMYDGGDGGNVIVIDSILDLSTISIDISGATGGMWTNGTPGNLTLNNSGFKTSYGIIEFGFAISNETNFTSAMSISDNNIYVDSDNYQDYNVSADLTLYDPIITGAEPYFMARDGILCDETTIPSCVNSTPLNTEIVIFTVSAFTDYSIMGTLGNVPPTHDTPLLNSTFGTNLETEDLTCYPQNLYDANEDTVYPIFNWYKNDQPITILNMPFETNSSSITKDYSGYGNDGTIIGPIWTTGKIGGAYEFDGIDDYITAPNLGFNSGDPVTVEFWANPNEFDSLMGGVHFNNDRMGLRMSTYSAKWNWQCNALGPVATGTFTIGEWQHVAGTYDGSNLRIYINGNLEQTTPCTAYTNSDTTIIGWGQWTYLNGTMDQVRIYDKALSIEQIYQLYSEGDNYLTNTIVSQETAVDDIWMCQVTPNDLQDDGETKNSNNLTIMKLLQCGNTITENTTLTENLNCNGTALYIGADNLVLNCNGYSITGSATGYGLDASTPIDAHTNIKVENCHISNFETDIYAKGADKNGTNPSGHGGNIEVTNSVLSTINTSGGNAFGGLAGGGSAGDVALTESDVTSIEAVGGVGWHMSGYGGDISITNSTAESVDNQGDGAHTITIKNSNVGSTYSNGDYGPGGSVTITDSNVTSVSSSGGTDNSGYGKTGGTVDVLRSNIGTINSYGGSGTWDGGYGGDGGTVTITDSTITTLNSNGGQGYPMQGGTGGLVTITNSTVTTANSNGGSAPDGGNGGSIIVTDSALATVNSNGNYGIDGGSGGSIIITSSTAASINSVGGSGQDRGGSGGSIRLTDSDATAISSKGGAGDNDGANGGQVIVIDSTLNLSIISIDISGGIGYEGTNGLPGTLTLNQSGFENSFGVIEYSYVQTSDTDFTSIMSITDNNIFVDSTSYQDYNVSADLTLYDPTITGAEPYFMARNSIECNATTTPSCINLTPLNADTVIFNISAFTIYSIRGLPICGNGILEFGEQCDDSNNVSGDGCSENCESETVLENFDEVNVTDNGDGTYTYLFIQDNVTLIELGNNNGMIDLTNLNFDYQSNGISAMSISNLTLNGTTKSISLKYKPRLCAVDDNQFFSGVALGNWNCSDNPNRIIWDVSKQNPCGDPGNPVQGKDANGISLPQYTCEKYEQGGETYAKMSGFNHTTVISVPYIVYFFADYLDTENNSYNNVTGGGPCNQEGPCYGNDQNDSAECSGPNYCVLDGVCYPGDGSVIMDLDGTGEHYAICVGFGWWDCDTGGGNNISNTPLPGMQVCELCGYNWSTATNSSVGEYAWSYNGYGCCGDDPDEYLHSDGICYSYLEQKRIKEEKKDETPKASKPPKQYTENEIIESEQIIAGSASAENGSNISLNTTFNMIIENVTKAKSKKAT